ncbi:uncharacterized protein [Watersipora subatra]|uniref:uncharacterized protein n=1 Tax=Watersipora subatra TaxID=2589382 RepID=UPI00355C4B47
MLSLKVDKICFVVGFLLIASMIVLLSTPSGLKKRKNFPVYSSESKDSESLNENEYNRILHDTHNWVNEKDYKIHLLPAVPGSGSAWSRLAISALTGLTSGVAGRCSSKHCFYLKTHFPYLNSTRGLYDNMHPDVAVILIRNPFDAGASEFTRVHLQKISQKFKRDHPNEKGIKHNKYTGLESMKKDLYLETSKKSDETVENPSIAFDHFMTGYLSKWRNFHKYWLEDYKGNVKAVLFQDMVENVERFQRVAEYFGYNFTQTPERTKRLQCFKQNSSMTKKLKRPQSDTVDHAKEVLKEYYAADVKRETSYVESLLRRKYKREFEI